MALCDEIECKRLGNWPLLQSVSVTCREQVVRLYGANRHGQLAHGGEVAYAKAGLPLPPVAIVSLTSPGRMLARFDPILVPMVLRLHVEDSTDTCGPNPMTPEQAEQIADFVRAVAHVGLPLVVHCHGGVSRSAGTAAAVLDAMGPIGHDGTDIWDDPSYIPNEWCFELVRAAFGMPASRDEIRECIKRNVDVWTETHRDME